MVINYPKMWSLPLCQESTRWGPAISLGFSVTILMKTLWFHFPPPVGARTSGAHGWCPMRAVSHLSQAFPATEPRGSRSPHRSPQPGGAGPIHGERGRNARWLVIGAVRHARAGRGLACRRCRVTAAPGNGGGAAPRWGGTGAAGPTPLLGTGGWWAGGGVCGGALFGLGVREKVCVGSFVWRVCAERGEGT